MTISHGVGRFVAWAWALERRTSVSFRHGTVYFDGVWTQVSDPGQRALLRCMAQRDEPWPLSELEGSRGLAVDHLRRQLRWAKRHDILCKAASDAPTWRFSVPLLREWVREQ